VVIAAALLGYERPEPEGISIPAILVDLAPPPSAPKIETADLAPGPQVQEAEAPPPEPPKLETIEQLPPAPPQPTPIVAAPPKVEPKPEPSPAKPQPVRDKRPVKKQQVEKSTAAKAERIAPEQPSPSSGASAAAAAASYRAMLVAHLQRFKRWPAGAQERGESGTVVVGFTVSRNGRMTSARMTKSSGFSSLDQEAMAWMQRAQPLPQFPAEVREAAMNFAVPLSWAR
jgi:protein TonB